MAAIIYAATDGSALNNPGPAGWAWVIDENNYATGGWPLATNNQAELYAILALLEATAQAPNPLHIYSDSQYAVNSLTKWLPGWKAKGWRKSDGKPVLNQDLLMRLDAALAGRDVQFEWVKAHATHALNNVADQLAHAAASAYAAGTTPDFGPGFNR